MSNITKATWYGQLVLIFVCLLYVLTNVWGIWAWWHLNRRLREASRTMPVLQKPAEKAALWQWFALPTLSLEVVSLYNFYRDTASHPPYFRQYSKAVKDKT